MKTTFLDFEQPIADLETKIEELRFVQDDSALDISEEIARLQKKSQTLTKDIYAKLNAWQIAQVARHRDVAVGIVDVKSYYIETPEDIAARVRRCLEYVPADRLVLAPDCGLSQTARWAARRKLQALCAGAALVRQTL